MDAIEWEREKDRTREEKTPFNRLYEEGKERALQPCKPQSLTSGFYMWQRRAGECDNEISIRLRRSGGGQVKIGGDRIQSSSFTVLQRTMEEKEGRT